MYLYPGNFNNTIYDVTEWRAWGDLRNVLITLVFELATLMRQSTSNDQVAICSSQEVVQVHLVYFEFTHKVSTCYFICVHCPIGLT